MEKSNEGTRKMNRYERMEHYLEIFITIGVLCRFTVMTIILCLCGFAVTGCSVKNNGVKGKSIAAFIYYIIALAISVYIRYLAF